MTSFGDMMRVPGGKGLLRLQGQGRRHPHGLLAARLAQDPRENPDKKVVFMAIGFETTAPSTP